MRGAGGTGGGGRGPEVTKLRVASLGSLVLDFVFRETVLGFAAIFDWGFEVDFGDLGDFTDFVFVALVLPEVWLVFMPKILPGAKIAPKNGIVSTHTIILAHFQ